MDGSMVFGLIAENEGQQPAREWTAEANVAWEKNKCDNCQGRRTLSITPLVNVYFGLYTHVDSALR